MGNYPNVKRMINEMAISNSTCHAPNCGLKPVGQWVYPDNVDELESLIGRLSDDELFMFACPDADELAAWLNDHPEFAPLDRFLADVFDGPLTPNFFVR